MAGIIPEDFYRSEDVCQLARDLLGKLLVTFKGSQRTAGIIVETEAYKAPEDKASHAYNFRRTSRTETMYMSGGFAYVYLCYGIHRLFNVVTGPVDCPHAVLIRAIEPTEGVEYMLDRSGLESFSAGFTSGPGLLTRALGIGLEDDAQPLWYTGGSVYIEETNRVILHRNILASPRVGVSYAGEWATKPWRYRLNNSVWTSKAK